MEELRYHFFLNDIHALWGRLRTHVIQLTSLCLSVKVYAFTIEILAAEYHARFHSCRWFGSECMTC